MYGTLRVNGGYSLKKLFCRICYNLSKVFFQSGYSLEQPLESQK